MSKLQKKSLLYFVSFPLCAWTALLTLAELEWKTKCAFNSLIPATSFRSSLPGYHHQLLHFTHTHTQNLFSAPPFRESTHIRKAKVLLNRFKSTCLDSFLDVSWIFERGGGIWYRDCVCTSTNRVQAQVCGQVSLASMYGARYYRASG